MTTPRIVCSYDTAEPTVWRVEAEYRRATSIGEVVVPVGTVWNGASVPRELWSFIPPWGSYSGAALVHDYLYQTKTCHRSEADRVFLELMVEDGVPVEQAALMYRAVRLFGERFVERMKIAGWLVLMVLAGWLATEVPPSWAGQWLVRCAFVWAMGGLAIAMLGTFASARMVQNPVADPIAGGAIVAAWVALAVMAGEVVASRYGPPAIAHKLLTVGVQIPLVIAWYLMASQTKIWQAWVGGFGVALAGAIYGAWVQLVLVDPHPVLDPLAPAEPMRTMAEATGTLPFEAMLSMVALGCTIWCVGEAILGWARRA